MPESLQTAYCYKLQIINAIFIGIYSLKYVKAHPSVSFKQLISVMYYVGYHYTIVFKKATGITDVLGTFKSR